MRWQKTARILIAAFVIVFAGVVFYSMRQRATVSSATPASEVRVSDEKAIVESGQGSSSTLKDGKVLNLIEYAKSLTYEGGRTKALGVTLNLKDRDGRPIKMTADECEASTPPDKPQELTLGKCTGNVKLATETGITVTSGEATYDDSQGLLTMPGAVEFTKGRMKGTGLGATYDRNRDVLWIKEKAHIVAPPDEKGQGALEATAASAGLDRAQHYFKLLNGAKIISDGRTAEATEITLLMDEASEKIQQMQLREQSRITGTGAGAQLMTARHIDMTYAPDGRTLQSSKLMENGVVDLPGAAGGPGRRIAGTTIDIGMAPDGSTVTSLVAVDKVQVDLPAEGETPARQIRSTSLRASGAPGQGLRNAVFDGPVDFVETRPATAKTPAAVRKARSQRLIVDTKPGLGPLERADFRANVRFEDGQLVAEAPRALYNIDKDLLDLAPSTEGEAGVGPVVTNPQLTIQARNIHIAPSTQKLTADTDVRSTIKAKQKEAKASNGHDGEQTRMPVMLTQDKPVNVTSNRVAYDGVSEATYAGNALLWQQDGSRIAADLIVLNDRTGNLKAQTGVRTTMTVMDEDPKTKVKTPTVMNASSDALVYDDAKRLATYTATGQTLARLTSVQGDMQGTRIDLYLKESGNEVERAEVDGKVSVKLPELFATGSHLVYTQANDTYVLTGEPAMSIQKDDKGGCKQTDGSTITYGRQTMRTLAEGIQGVVSTRSKPLDVCPAELRN
ncbi:MAG TPA: LptA/OstA family protein [Vicinamibacterales bacterium]|nr:LptA/OstA family protein [Vicinamibacterales bacterium]